MVVFVVFFAFSVVDHEEVNRWCIFTELCVAGNSEGNSDSLGSCDATLPLLSRILSQMHVQLFLDIR